jgi:hypothetical protein
MCHKHIIWEAPFFKKIIIRKCIIFLAKLPFKPLYNVRLENFLGFFFFWSFPKEMLDFEVVLGDAMNVRESHTVKSRKDLPPPEEDKLFLKLSFIIMLYPMIINHKNHAN